MAESLPLAAAVAPFQSLVRPAARQPGLTAIIDGEEPSAVVISADQVEDLVDAVAVARSGPREADGGTNRIQHQDVRYRLGFDR